MEIDETAKAFLAIVLAISCSVLIVAELKLVIWYRENVFAKWYDIRRKAIVIVVISGLSLAAIVVAHGLNRNNNVTWPSENSIMGTTN
jgi:hypothetical protein